MAAHSSSIDDLLMGSIAGSAPPPAVENEYDVDFAAETQGVMDVTDEAPQPKKRTLEPEGGYSDDQLGEFDKIGDKPDDEDEFGTAHEESDELPEESEEFGEDEYGNKKEVLSKSMQKRLERQAESMRRKHEAEMQALRSQLTPQQTQQVQQAAQNFQADPNSDDDWQQQLAAFVKQTVQNMTAEQSRAQQEAEVKRQEGEFRDKFQQGMDRFDDFVDVVGHQPVTDAMVTATRGMKDPAAFLYAASKRAPQELERIAKIRDPYTQMSETIRLEERLKKSKPTTQAPRPLARTREDAPVKHKKTTERDDSIESLIAQSDARRLAQRNAKIRR